MTTSTDPGATGRSQKPRIYDILAAAALYAVAVWWIVYMWGDPSFQWRGAAAGVALPFLAPVVVRGVPRWVAILAVWAVVSIIAPDWFLLSSAVGACWLLVLGLPTLFVGFFVLAFLARRAAAADEVAADLNGRIIVGLSGYAGSGKDTAAEALIAKGFTRVSFFDKAREVALALNPLIPVVVPGIRGAADQTTYVRLADWVEAHGWTEAKRNLEVRNLLQRLGTEAGRRVLGENVWVDAVMRDLPDGNLVFTDMRFPNEYDAVIAAGGVAVRINRPGVEAVNAHPSETALDEHLFHAVIENGGTPQRLGASLVHFVSSHTGELL